MGSALLPVLGNPGAGVGTSAAAGSWSLCTVIVFSPIESMSSESVFPAKASAPPFLDTDWAKLMPVGLTFITTIGRHPSSSGITDFTSMCSVRNIRARS